MPTGKHRDQRGLHNDRDYYICRSQPDHDRVMAARAEAIAAEKTAKGHHA